MKNLLSRFVLIMVFFLSTSLFSCCQKNIPVGDLPYFGVTNIDTRIVRIEDQYGQTYNFDNNHRVLLTNPTPISIDTSIVASKIVYDKMRGQQSSFELSAFPLTVVSVTYDNNNLLSDDLLVAESWSTRCYDRMNRVRTIRWRDYFYDANGRISYTYGEVEGSIEKTIFTYNAQGDVESELIYAGDIGSAPKLFKTVQYHILEKDARGNWLSRKEIERYVEPEWSSFNETTTVSRRIWYDGDLLPDDSAKKL